MQHCYHPFALDVIRSDMSVGRVSCRHTLGLMCRAAHTTKSYDWITDHNSPFLAKGRLGIPTSRHTVLVEEHG